MDGELLEQTDTLRLMLYVDDEPRNPREDYDHLASVITVSDRDFNLIDKDPGPLGHAWRHYLDRAGGSRYYRDAIALFTRYAVVYHGATVREHYPHDGPVSVWYLTREVAEGENGTPDPAACLESELQEWQQYLDGDVYGFSIEAAVTWHAGDDTMVTWRQVESCWGIFGYEWAQEEARSAWAAHLAAEARAV